MLAIPTVRQPADPTIDLTPRPVRILCYDPTQDFHDQWYFTLDETRTETIEERRERYLTDTRLMHMGGLATMSNRKHSYMKRLNADSQAWRRDLRAKSPIDEVHYDQLVAERTAAWDDPARADAITTQLEALDAERQKSPDYALLKVYLDNLLDGLPEPIAAGVSPLWPVNVLFHSCRQRKWLNDWYEYEKKDPPGRRPGSKNRTVKN